MFGTNLYLLSGDCLSKKPILKSLGDKIGLPISQERDWTEDKATIAKDFSHNVFTFPVTGVELGRRFQPLECFTFRMFLLRF